MGLRAWLGGRHDWRFALSLIVVSSLVFGLFHFTYPAPWNTLGTAVNGRRGVARRLHPVRR